MGMWRCCVDIPIRIVSSSGANAAGRLVNTEAAAPPVSHIDDVFVKLSFLAISAYHCFKFCLVCYFQVRKYVL